MQGTVTDDRSRTARANLDGVANRHESRSGPDAIGEALAERIGPQKYKVWFQNSTRFTCVEGYLKIGVPNLFMVRWLEDHFLEDAKAAALAATGAHLKVSFVVDPELCAAGRSGSVAPARKKEASAVRGQGPQVRGPFGDPDPRSPTPDAGSSPRGGAGAARFTLDSFVVGPSNELAHSAAKAVVREQQSPFNPLFIHGGHGVGKTHLLQGICNGVAQARPQTNWLYLSAEEFANQFVLALKTKKLEAFRHRMRQTDLLAIDDVHFLASKPSTQEEFLHTFNTISLAGKQVVLVSDAHPKMIGQLSEKLVNRFVSGMVVKIEAPDLETRCEICRRFAQRLSFRGSGIKDQGSQTPDMQAEVIRYVAEHVRTNVRELEGAMLKLVACGLLAKEKVTLAMARQVLAEHLDRCDPAIHLSEVETAVAAYFGTTAAHIHSAKKDRTVSLARRFSMYLTRKHTNLSSSEIGRCMGDKNHATVLMACRKVEELLRRDADLNWQGPNGNKVAKAKTILSDLEASLSH